MGVKVAANQHRTNGPHCASQWCAAFTDKKIDRILLEHWEDIQPTQPQTISWDFTSDQLSALTTYSQNDGIVGLGLDSDCVFLDDQVNVTITTATIPEPAGMFLMGTVLLGLSMTRRKIIR